MASEWTMLIPLKIFTRIKAEFSQDIKDTFSMTDINFTMVGSNDMPPRFPFVYVQATAGSEKAEDFEGNNINAQSFNFQIDVTDNKTQANARKVMTEVLRIFKSLGFKVTTTPNYITTQDNTHRMVARFSKTFCANDKF